MLMTIPQVAQLTNRHRSTVMSWILQGRVKARKLGRDWMIDSMDLEAAQNAKRIMQPPGPKNKRKADDGHDGTEETVS